MSLWNIMDSISIQIRHKKEWVYFVRLTSIYLYEVRSTSWFSCTVFFHVYRNCLLLIGTKSLQSKVNWHGISMWAGTLQTLIPISGRLMVKTNKLKLHLFTLGKELCNPLVLQSHRTFVYLQRNAVNNNKVSSLADMTSCIPFVFAKGIIGVYYPFGETKWFSQSCNKANFLCDHSVTFAKPVAL